MALILSIETSTSVCSVALHENGKLISVVEIHQEFSHASKLGLLVDQVLNLGDLKIEEISAVAVSSGPGSYTGLRIGISLAKGLCYALNIPLIAVPTLQVLAAKVSHINFADSFLCPMIDARRMEVYCQVMDFNLNEIEPVKPIIIDEKSFEKYLRIKPVIFFGNGSMKCRDVLIQSNAKFLSDIHPSAVQLGPLAFEKFRRDETEDVDLFVPYYLKEFYTKQSLEKVN
jgi:tRNA threonylcarbamoyladenosine biosynthesis protein TsaB